MTSHSDAAATDNDYAAVAVTVATVGGGVGDRAVVAGIVAADTDGDRHRCYHHRRRRLTA